MDWIGTAGLALLLASAGILGTILPGLWAQEIGRERSEVYDRGSLEEKLQDDIRRKRTRLRQWVFGCGWVLLLASIFVLARFYHPAIPTQTVQVLVSPALSDRSGTAGPPLDWLWPLSILVILLLISGTVMLVRGPFWVRLAGLAAITAGLATHYHLVDKIQIGTMFAFKPHIETPIQADIEARMGDIKAKILSEIKGEIESLIGKIPINIQAEVEAYMRKLGALGPEYLGQFVNFNSGRSELPAGMDQRVLDICKRWKERDPHQDSLLLAVGETDRVPLGADARWQYKSNFGLARARAETVKSKIVACGVSSPQVLALVSGPQHTPERTVPAAAVSGVAEDRAVHVWAIWSWHDIHQSKRVTLE